MFLSSKFVNVNNYFYNLLKIKLFQILNNGLADITKL